MSNLEKWKQICLEADNVASEVLNSEEAKAELTIDEARELLKYFGDDEFIEINDNYEFIIKGKQFTPKDFEDKYKIYGYFGFVDPPYFSGKEIREDVNNLLKTDDGLFGYIDSDGFYNEGKDGSIITKEAVERFKKNFLIGNKKEGKYPLSNNKQYYLTMVGKHEDVLIAKAKKKKED